MQHRPKQNARTFHGTIKRRGIERIFLHTEVVSVCTSNTKHKTQNTKEIKHSWISAAPNDPSKSCPTLNGICTNNRNSKDIQHVSPKMIYLQPRQQGNDSESRSQLFKAVFECIGSVLEVGVK